jgi:hypothetical protein
MGLTVSPRLLYSLKRWLSAQKTEELIRALKSFLLPILYLLNHLAADPLKQSPALKATINIFPIVDSFLKIVNSVSCSIEVLT